MICVFAITLLQEVFEYSFGNEQENLSLVGDNISRAIVLHE